MPDGHRVLLPELWGRSEVDPRMAGKAGRCKKCGQHMEIPRAEQMAVMPALARADVEGGLPGPHAAGSSMDAWLKTGAISQVGLAPLTVDRMPIRNKKADPLDQAEDSKPYVLAQPVREDRGRVEALDNVVLMLWRKQIRGYPEDLPQDQPGGLPDLGPVPHGPAARHLGEEPADGDARGGRGGPAQCRGPHFRRGHLGPRPVPRWVRLEEAQEAASTCGRTGPDDRPGRPGIPLQPMALHGRTLQEGSRRHLRAPWKQRGRWKSWIRPRPSPNPRKSPEPPARREPARSDRSDLNDEMNPRESPMSTFTTEDYPPIPEVIELEATVRVGLVDPEVAGGSISSPRPRRGDGRRESRQPRGRDRLAATRPARRLGPLPRGGLRGRVPLEAVERRLRFLLVAPPGLDRPTVRHRGCGRGPALEPGHRDEGPVAGRRVRALRRHARSSSPSTSTSWTSISSATATSPARSYP